jgi:phage terminase large subunit-like protein
MTAFDTAWALLKMPFHGTSSWAYDRMLRDGEMMLGETDAVWFAHDPYEALYYAERATKGDRTQGIKSHPILLRIPRKHDLVKPLNPNNPNYPISISEEPVPVGDVEVVWSWKDYDENPSRPVSNEIDLLEDN